MDIQEFLFDLPLYQKVYEEEGCDEIIDFLYKSFQKEKDVDGYNSIKKCNSTFSLYSGINSTITNPPMGYNLIVGYIHGKEEEFEVFETILKCKRYGTYIHFFVRIEKEPKSISKVGQYPSVADIHIGQVHKYDKVLSKERMREFTKAIGLAANGVGVGSFVYLRRIFEHLVFEAKEMAKKENPDFNETEFEVSRMNEKIVMLSGYIPDFMVENNHIYGILSKGIHELSEEECKRYFTILRESIEMILDEKLEAVRKEAKKKEIKRSLSQIASSIK